MGKMAIITAAWVGVLLALPGRSAEWVRTPNPGPAYPIVEAVLDDSHLYVAGYVPLPNDQGSFDPEFISVSRWDGTRWKTILDSLDGDVRSLVMQDGKLYMTYENALLAQPRHSWISAWDGSTWKRVAETPVDGARLGDMLSFGGKLVAACDSNLWEWDGAAWRNLAGPGFPLGALFAHGDTLYAGGFPSSFRPVPKLARWAQGQWTSIPVDPNCGVRALGWFGGSLVVGGIHFPPDIPGTDSTSAFARLWDGMAWQELPLPKEKTAGFLDGIETAGTDLYLSTKFKSLGNQDEGRLFRWNGTVLQEVTGFKYSDHANRGRDMSVLKYGRGKLWVAGSFAGKDSLRADNVIQLEDGKWTSLSGPAPTGVGPTAYPHLALKGSEICAVGWHHFTSHYPSDGFDCWDGSAWKPLHPQPAPIPAVGRAPYVQSSAWDGSRMVVAGMFDSLAGVPARNIAAWEAGKWTALGEGLGSWSRVLFAQDALHAIGSDSTVLPKDQFNALWKWDGSRWKLLARDSALAAGTSAHRLISRSDEIWLAGERIVSGEVEVFIHAWNGTAWRDVHAGLPAGKPQGRFREIQTGPGGTYLVTQKESPQPVYFIHAWNGQGWTQIGTVTSWLTLAVTRAGLYIAGHFRQVNGIEIHSIARWDGKTWLPLGKELDFQFAGIVLQHEGRLHVYGNYRDQATGRFATGLATWDTEGDGVASISRAGRGSRAAGKGWRLVKSGSGTESIQGYGLTGRRIRLEGRMPTAPMILPERAEARPSTDAKAGLPGR